MCLSGICLLPWWALTLGHRPGRWRFMRNRFLRRTGRAGRGGRDQWEQGGVFSEGSCRKAKKKGEPGFIILREVLLGGSFLDLPPQSEPCSRAGWLRTVPQLHPASLCYSELSFRYSQDSHVCALLYHWAPLFRGKVHQIRLIWVLPKIYWKYEKDFSWSPSHRWPF